MKRQIIYSLQFISLLLIILISAPAVMAQSDGTDGDGEKSVSFVHIQPVGSLPASSPVTISAQVTDDKGSPLPSQPLILYLNSENAGKSLSDEVGRVSFELQNLPVGEYKVDLFYAGNETYFGTNDILDFTIRPLQLDISSVPPIAGISIVVDGKPLLTNQQGYTYLEFENAGNHAIRISVPDKLNSARSHLTFTRWHDLDFDFERELALTEDQQLQAGFIFSYPIKLQFVDATGQNVDATRIDNLIFSNSAGDQIEVDSHEEQWLPANRIYKRNAGLESANEEYTLSSLTLDNEDIHLTQRQNFVSEIDSVWQIQLPLFSVLVDAADALLGSALPTEIYVTDIDGFNTQHSFDGLHALDIGPLKRGVYTIQAKSGLGFSLKKEIVVTENKSISLPVITIADISFTVLIFVFLWGIWLMIRYYRLTRRLQTDM